MYCVASMRPWAMSLPWSDVGPVRSTRFPILMVWALAGPAPRASVSSASVTERASEDVSRRMATSLSVRIGPQLPVAPEPLPDPREPGGLVHEEEDDGETEDDVTGRGDHSERVGVDAGERGGAQL